MTYSNIKIFVDNKEASLGKDSKGNKIEPFIYNGTTYLPVRAVSEALGEEVRWIDRNVYVGTYPGLQESFYDKAYPYKINSIYTYDSSFDIGGKRYNQAFEFYDKNS